LATSPASAARSDRLESGVTRETRRRRTLELSVPRDEALLRTARAVRRLGGRVTRLDADEGTLEGRTRGRRVERVIRILAIAEAEERTRLQIESTAVTGGWIDLALGGAALRRLAREIIND
jgi:hypothetical protein